MKKLIIFGIMLSLLSGIYMSTYSADDTTTTKLSAEEKAQLQDAISKYKTKNYLGCISNLRQYVQKDPANAVAWYYLGNSYMNVSLKQDAQYAFEQVIVLNTVPKLTSYAIQAKLCMEKTQKCKYYNLNKKEIAKLKENPSGFLKTYEAEKSKTSYDPEETEIKKLIQGSYGSNLHPQAETVIRTEKANINSAKSAPARKATPSATPFKNNKASLDDNDSEKYAKAVELIKQDMQMQSLSMMLDRPDNNHRNEYQNYLLNGNNEMTPEMIQAIMMQNMIPNI